MIIRKIALAESHEGCEHYQLQLTPLADGKLEIKILSTDAEARVLKGHLFTEHNDNPSNDNPKPKHKVFFDNNKAIINLGDNIYFGGRLVGKYDAKTNEYAFLQVTLPEARMISEYNDTKTRVDTEYNAVGHNAHKRIDGHTHYVAIFPMKAALEKALEMQPVYIPSLVILKILKDKNIMSSRDDGANDWYQFLNDHKVQKTDKFFKQKDCSEDLITEDFILELKTMSDTERSFCIDGNKAYYVSLELFKRQLTPEEWGNFCNGFDLSAAHACDFTEHMETAYNLRNWFGKDTTFLEAQLRVIYDEYEKQQIDYVEIPAGFLKKTDCLHKFIEITAKIEKERAVAGKSLINLRPGLSIARLMSAHQFRTALFDFIPLILRNPSLASISVLAHETNPTTQHMSAIREFAAIINKLRPGFTIEVHAGETATYGDVNLSHARLLSQLNRNLVIRAGHAQYGSHTEEQEPNFFEEKCPISNLTLIDCEPEIQVNVLLGIALGKSNIIWGSDGSIYNPNYSPAKQEAFYRALLGHENIQNELESRWLAGTLGDAFSADTYEESQQKLIAAFNTQLERNGVQENSYIDFKQAEEKFHELRLNIIRYRILLIKDGKKLRNKLTSELAAFEHMMLSDPSFIGLQRALSHKTNLDTLDRLNKDCKKLIKQLTDELMEPMKDPDKKHFLLSLENNIERVFSKRSDVFRQRSAVKLYYKLYKLINSNKTVSCIISHPKFELWLKYLEVSANKNDIINLLTSLYNRWPVEEETIIQELKTLYHSNNEPNYIVLSGFAEDFCNLTNLIVNSYRPMEQCSSPQEISLTSTRSRSMLNVHKLEIEMEKLALDLPIIDAIPEPNHPINTECELFLDRDYLHHPVSQKWHDRNAHDLKRASTQTRTISKDALVIFGNPEWHPEATIQNEYILNLYKNIFELLITHQKNKQDIILLGNVKDGINPMVYQVINDNSSLFNSLNIIHVVSRDEHLSSLQNPIKSNFSYHSTIKMGINSSSGSMMKKPLHRDKVVRYHVIEKHRQEAQIGYADFIQQNNLSNILMIGGGDFVTSDIKNTLAERKLSNGEFLGEKIQFYPDGFHTTRSSSAYLEGSPEQTYKNYKCYRDEFSSNQTQNSLLQSSEFSARSIKTEPMLSNLSYAYRTLDEWLRFYDSRLWSENKFSHDDFLRAFAPLPLDNISSSNSSGSDSIFRSDTPSSISDAKMKVYRFFRNYIADEATQDSLKCILDLFKTQYGVLAYINKELMDLNLEKAIYKRIEELKGLENSTSLIG